jgi:hypothetical protein
VLVHCGYDASSITVSLFGDREGRRVAAEGPVVTNPVPAEDKLEDDPTLPVGTDKVVDDHTFDGFDVAWTRTVTAPNRNAVVERFFTHYQALGRRIAHGVGPTDSTTTGPGASSTTGSGSTGPGSTGTGPATTGPGSPTSSAPTSITEAPSATRAP